MPTSSVFPPTVDTFPADLHDWHADHTHVNDAVVAIQTYMNATTVDVGAGGTADDTSAVTAALALGGVVRFRPGSTYTISSTLSPSSNTVIIAYGAKIIRKAGALNIIGCLIGEGVSNVHVYGGIWDGNRSGDNAPTFIPYLYYNGIRFQGCHDCSCTDVTVQNWWSHGIFTGGQITPYQVTRRIVINTPYAINCRDAGICTRPGSSGVLINDAEVWGGGTSGIQITRASWVQVNGGMIYGSGPDEANEGDGISIQGGWFVEINDVQATASSRTGCFVTDTSEAVTGFTWKGAWSATQSPQYAANNVVTYQGLAYIATQTVPTGLPPQSGDETYWVLCPYDNYSPRRPAQLVEINGGQYNYNSVVAHNGLWNSATAYQYNDTVVGSNGKVYASKNVGALTNVDPTTDGGVHWVDNSTNQSSSGIQVARVNGIAIRNAEASYNSGSGTSGGLVISDSVAGLVCYGLTAVGNQGPGITNNWADAAGSTLTTALTNGTAYTSLSVVALAQAVTNGDSILITSGADAQVVTASANAAVNATSISVTSFTANATYPIGAQIKDTTAWTQVNSPLEFYDPHIDGAGLVSAQNVLIAQSAKFKGGVVKKSAQQNIVLQANLPATTGALWSIDGMSIEDASTAGYPGVECGAPPSGVTVNVNIVRCLFPNSTGMGNVYQEDSGLGTTNTYIDQCGFGTTTRVTISQFGGTTAGFSYAGSAVGPNNYAIPGSSSVRGADQPLAQVGSYTLLGIDNWVVFTLGGAATATLPSAATCRKGKRYVVSNANASTSALTLAAAAGTVPTASIAAGAAVTVISDGTNWQRAA